MQSAAHGADRQVEDFRDRFIAAAVDFPQHEHGPMVFIERGQRRLHLSCPFLPLEPLGRGGIAGGNFLLRSTREPVRPKRSAVSFETG